ncbi:MAG: hypothetical protein K0R24_704 [Gammaproteobacteria bacterium]|jgi:hypothetical protein|nr:hypothetical protein [Gammaproteobacteria bacterium]
MANYERQNIRFLIATIVAAFLWFTGRMDGINFFTISSACIVISSLFLVIDYLIDILKELIKIREALSSVTKKTHAQ